MTSKVSTGLTNKTFGRKADAQKSINNHSLYGKWLEIDISIHISHVGSVDISEVYSEVMNRILTTTYKVLWGREGNKVPYNEVENFIAGTIARLKYSQGYDFGNTFMEVFHRMKKDIVKAYYKYAKTLAQTPGLISQGEIDDGSVIIIDYTI